MVKIHDHRCLYIPRLYLYLEKELQRERESDIILYNLVFSIFMVYIYIVFSLFHQLYHIYRGIGYRRIDIEHVYSSYRIRGLFEFFTFRGISSYPGQFVVIIELPTELMFIKVQYQIKMKNYSFEFQIKTNEKIFQLILCEQQKANLFYQIKMSF